ncbi:MAG: HlyD family efflux transporter periplasmic adaptor subunit [Ahrensia sp.]|nr:HlyD family efflux transporter periplasmic adaptor subunit [Ahrensia sp.]
MVSSPTPKKLRPTFSGTVFDKIDTSATVKPPRKKPNEHLSVVDKDQQREISLLSALLKLEESIRQCESVDDIYMLAANESRKLVGARQVFVCLLDNRKRLMINAISSMERVDPTSLFVQWLTSVANKALPQSNRDEIRRFSTSEYSISGSEDQKTYPFPFMAWAPLKAADGALIGGLLMARETAWEETDSSRFEHLARVYAFGISRFETKLNRAKRLGIAKMCAMTLGTLIGAAMFMPVTMSTMAPVSVVPRDGVSVNATLDGVVQQISARPNAPVRKGDIIVKLDDEALRNAVETAQQKLAEAEANLASLTKSAFSSSDSKRELRTAVARVNTRRAELMHAEANLERTNIRAQRDGIAIVNERSRWSGRPVQIGEQIMQLADPGKIEFKIEVPVGDAIILSQERKVRFFMDESPLRPLNGTIRYSSFEATELSDGVLAYEVVADLDPASPHAAPRLGGHGTALLMGDEVPLYLYLFRKPLSAIRQFTGL